MYSGNRVTPNNMTFECQTSIDVDKLVVTLGDIVIMTHFLTTAFIGTVHSCDMSNTL